MSYHNIVAKDKLMTRSTSYKKHIACLESLWNTELEDRWSVHPILELIANMQDLKLAHLSCNTEPEFAYNLRVLSKRRSYGILYLAFHGAPGQVCLADDTSVSLEELQNYRGCINKRSHVGEFPNLRNMRRIEAR
jgi:hypothetical protein